MEPEQAHRFPITEDFAMAMVVKNNMSATKTLNTLNRNSKALSKSLAKVSSGMKINSAADDASGYSISERMRVQIRGLDQANQNTQNAVSLMKVAQGAVGSTVDILRTLKEKAINSANDTNTDADRATIQKEVDQSIDQVDDNAHVTFNGKYLIDGSHKLPDTVEEMIINALNTEWIENCLDLIEDSYGIKFRDEHAEWKNLSVRLCYNGEIDSNVLAQVAFTNVPGGKTDWMELQINMDQFGSLDTKDTANVNGRNPAGTGVLDRTISHELVHGIMASSITDFATLPLALCEGIAELVHGIDDLRADAMTPQSISASTLTAPVGTPSSEAHYAGGYMALRYMAQQGGGLDSIKRFMNVLVRQGASALDGAVAAATNGKITSWNDLANKFAADAAAAASNDAFLRDSCGIDLTNDDTGAIIGRDAGGKWVKDADSIVPEGGSTKFWYAPTGQTTTINGLTIWWTSDYQAKAGDMAFQVGTKANQAIKVGFNDMTAEGLGLKAADGTKLSLATQDKAKNAIRLLDQSIGKALDQQTTIGAIMSRLEYTSANLTLASENVQGAESTIRDADMAKEMAEYTKNNVLLQSAQSMLAQANQNSSAVLSLLQ